MGDRLLLILPTSTYDVHEFMTAAGGLEVEVVVAADRRQVLESSVPEGMLALDFSRPEKAVEQIVGHARRWPLRTVLGIDDHGALVAALAREALGLPGNSAAAVRSAGNKLLLRNALAAAGMLSPAFGVVSVDEDPRKAASSAPFPCVLKPLFLAASRGVIRADDEEAFERAFGRIKALLADPAMARRGGESARQILVEEYVPGFEVALEGLLTGGELAVLALFDKPDPLEGPYFAETLYITPSSLPSAQQQEIAKTTAAAAHALGLREGPVHAELRIDGDGTYLIECAARSIGGLCSRILSFGAGISLQELVLRHVLGLPVESLKRGGEPAAGVMMLPVPREGVLREVRGLDGARLVPQVDDVVITIPPDQEVKPLPEGDRYLGFMFARGDSPLVVEEALRRACRQLEIVIETTPPLAASPAGKSP